MSQSVIKWMKSTDKRIVIVYSLPFILVSLLIVKVTFARLDEKNGNTPLSDTTILAKTKKLAVKISADNKNALLEWRNVYHVNTSLFIVQRSTDGMDFQDIATIMIPEGHMDQADFYNYSDNLQIGKNKFFYYRIKAVGLNGQCSYSPVTAVAAGELETQLA